MPIFENDLISLNSSGGYRLSQTRSNQISQTRSNQKNDFLSFPLCRDDTDFFDTSMPHPSICVIDPNNALKNQNDDEQNICIDYVYKGLCDKIDNLFVIASSSKNKTSEENVLPVPDRYKRITDRVYSLGDLTDIIKYQNDNISNRKISNLLLIIDCQFDPSRYLKDVEIINLLFNGRSLKLSCIVVLPYSLGLSPELRTNFDYIFISGCIDFYSQRKRIYEHYVGMFPNFSSFDQIYKSLDGDHLIIKNRGMSRSLSDKIRYFVLEKSAGNYIKFIRGIDILQKPEKETTIITTKTNDTSIASTSNDEISLLIDDVTNAINYLANIRKRLKIMKEKISHNNCENCGVCTNDLLKDLSDNVSNKLLIKSFETENDAI